VAGFKKAFTNIGKDLSKRVERGLKQSYWSELYKSGLVDTIVGFIRKGVSVVQGEGRFKEYSDGYIKAIKDKRYPGKKRSPVNLTQSGDMLNSLKFQKSDGILKFTSPLAQYHNDGEGNLPERRLLPNRDGERFNPRVRKILRDSLAAAVKKQARSLGNIGSIRFKFK
jgi:hypothetical protein